MKSFKRFLKEDLEGEGDLYSYILLAGGQGLFSMAGVGYSSMLANLSGTAPAGGYSYVIVGAPQFLLDMFDYNGDGYIGPNDMMYVQIIREQMEQYASENDVFDIPFMFANEFRENWQELNEKFGLDLPDPFSFFQVPPGGTTTLPDADRVPNQEGGISSFSLSKDIRAFVSFIQGLMLTNFFRNIHTEQGELLEQFGDLNGDGVFDPFYTPANPDTTSDMYTAIILNGTIRYMGDVGVDLTDNDLIEIINSEGGVLGFLADVMYSPEAQDAEAQQGLTVFEYLQQYFQILVDAGIIDEIPPNPNGDGEQSDYEKLLQILSDWGEDGANFEDLLQLLSNWGQEDGKEPPKGPPTPPPTPPPPGFAPPPGG